MKKNVTRLLLAVGMCWAIGPYAHAAGVYAPYVDLSTYPDPAIDVVGVQQGIQQFTLAYVFANGSGCTPSWSGTEDIGSGNRSHFMTGIATSVKNYRANGGEIAASFGGPNGVPLMQACTSVSALKTAYQTVIDTYGLTHVDFDIEGAAQKDSAALARNFQAVAQLQSTMAAKGTPLHVTLTLPVMSSGLTSDGVSVVNAAINNKVAFDVVNIKAMNYGIPVANMGQAAVQAAQNTYSQLDAAYKAIGQSKTDPQLWQMVGVMPMNGVNDSAGETFSFADVQSLINLAQTNNLGMLSSWSVTRDLSCPSNGTYTAVVCSGVVQKPYDYARAFLQIGGSWGTGVTRNPAYSGGNSGNAGSVRQ